MPEEFISEVIKPDTSTFDTSRMAVGEPGLPYKFSWRDQTVIVKELIRTWRETGPCRHGSNEQYVRKHWYEVKTAEHGTMKIYFDKGKLGSRKEMGWRLYTISK